MPQPQLGQVFRDPVAGGPESGAVHLEYVCRWQAADVPVGGGLALVRVPADQELGQEELVDLGRDCFEGEERLAARGEGEHLRGRDIVEAGEPVLVAR